MTSFISRIIRAAKLDVHLYEEVEADTGAMGQAMGVVVLSSIAAGIGSIAEEGLAGLLWGRSLPLSAGISGHILLTSSAQNYFRSRRPRQALMSYCALLVFLAHPA